MELITGNITLEHFLMLAAVIFVIGVTGLLLNRKNVISVLMSIELMLLAANINFVAFSSYLENLEGQIASIIILTIAAAESAIGLAIVVAFYRKRSSIMLEDINELHG